MTDLAACYVLHQKQDIRREERPIPEPPPGHVLIRMRRMGICGSDMHYYQDGHLGTFIPTRPFVLGHEGFGEIAAVAADVTNLQPGTRVAIDPARPCGACRFCRTGRDNLCPSTSYLGSAATVPPTDGLFREYMAFPAPNCHPLPDEIDDAAAAMIEPLAVAMHAVRQAGTISGARVLVTGGGAIGQLILAVARAYGASTLALSDPIAGRRAFAVETGAQIALDPTSQDAVGEALRASNGGFDLAFEASGAPPALRQALHLLRPGGTVVQVGSLPAEVEVPGNLIMKRELRLVGSFRFAYVFPAAIELAASGRIDLKRLVTRTFPLDQFDAAMSTALSRDAAIKVHLTTDA